MEVSPIDWLPNELLEMVFEKAGSENISRISCVCKKWKTLAESDSLFKQFCYQRFKSRIESESWTKESINKESWKELFKKFLEIEKSSNELNEIDCFGPD